MKEHVGRCDRRRRNIRDKVVIGHQVPVIKRGVDGLHIIALFDHKMARGRGQRDMEALSGFLSELGEEASEILPIGAGGGADPVREGSCGAVAALINDCVELRVRDLDHVFSGA